MTGKAHAFRDDVVAGPDALERLAEAAEEPTGPLVPASRAARGARRVVLIGMGSSLSAARPVAARLRATGVDAVAEPASATPAGAAPPREGTVCVAISASGKTPEVLEAAERHRGVSLLLALTNDVESPLARVAPHTVPLLSGEERGGVACRTFQATQAALRVLFGHAGPDDLRRAAGSARALVESRGQWVAGASDVLDGAACIDVIGPEDRRASFEQAALMLREGPRAIAAGHDGGDWIHVGVYLTVHPGWRGIVFPGSRFDADVMEWVASRRQPVVAVGADLPGAAYRVPFPDCEHPLVAALVEVVAAELIAAELWDRAEARTPSGSAGVKRQEEVAE